MGWAGGEAELPYSRCSRKEASARPLGNSGLAGLTGLCTPHQLVSGYGLSGAEAWPWERLLCLAETVPKEGGRLVHQQPTFLAD